MTQKFFSLKINIVKMFSEFRDEDYQENFDKVQKLVVQTTNILTATSQPLGPWEKAELSHAQRALNSGHSKLALIAVGKALAVHQLTQVEYDYGFNFMTRKISKEEYANDLLADQKEAAEALRLVEKDAAQRLSSAEICAATELDKSQKTAASALIQENLVDARMLAIAQAPDLKRLKKEELEKIAHNREREHVISWMTGGYSVEPPAGLDSAPENAHTHASNTQQRAAQELEGSQNMAAIALKISQHKTATNLKENQTQAAINLNEHQEKTARKLAADQESRAVNKTKNDQE